jgi:hypothetical protein
MSTMELVADVQRFRYPGLWPAQECWCRLRVYRQPGMARLLMVATEAADNPGASITNAAEGLWTRAWEEFMPQQQGPPLAVEHYPPNSVRGATVDLVEFGIVVAPGPGRARGTRAALGQVRWSRFSPALLNRMVGAQVVAEPE